MFILDLFGHYMSMDSLAGWPCVWPIQILPKFAEKIFVFTPKHAETAQFKRTGRRVKSIMEKKKRTANMNQIHICFWACSHFLPFISSDTSFWLIGVRGEKRIGSFSGLWGSLWAQFSCIYSDFILACVLPVRVLSSTFHLKSLLPLLSIQRVFCAGKRHFTSFSIHFSYTESRDSSL